MLTLKELQGMIGIQAKAGPRISRFRELHSRQEEDEDFINLRYDLKVQGEFQKIKVPTARQLVETFISHLPLSNPVVEVIPFKDNDTYRRKVVKQQEFYDAFLHLSMQQSENFLLNGARDIGVDGEAFFKLVLDIDALQAEKGEADEQTEDRLMERMPVKLITPHPRNCYPSADHIDTHPVDMIEVYPVFAEQVRQVFPKWKSNVANNKLVRFVEYWSTKQRCFLAEGVPLTDGIEDNPFGFVPYSHIYSGWGMGGSDLPENKAVGLIRFLHDVLKGEARLYSYHDMATAFAALPMLDVSGSRAEYEKDGVVPKPKPGMTFYRGDNEEPTKVIYAASGLPAGILNSIAVYRDIINRVQSEILRGKAPPGVEAGYPMALMAGEARLLFGVPLDYLAVALARSLEMVRLLVRDVVKEPISVWGKSKAITLNPKDCEGACRVNVKFEAATPEGMMNEALGLQRLRQGKSISQQTELELSPLIKNPQKELVRIEAESLAKHPVMQRQAGVKAWEILYGAKEALRVEQAMREGEEGAMRKAESTGIPPGGVTEGQLPEDVLTQAILGRRGKAMRGEGG